MTKIIFIDFDGTLYSHTLKKIPESAVKALNDAHDKGIKVFLCTGRSLSELYSFDLSMIDIDGMICNNGQIAYDKNYNIIYDYPLSGEIKDIIIDVFNKKDITVFLNTATDIFCNYVSDHARKVQNDINTPLPPIKEYENEDFYMCSMYNNNEDFPQLKHLKQVANIVSWFDGAIDVIPKTTSKATGIQNILDYCGLTKEESMGIGDSDNDVDMVKYCNIGISMGNGYESTKKVADYITDDIDNDGIYKALKHFGVI